MDAITAIETINNHFNNNEYEKALELVSNYENIFKDRKNQIELILLKSKILRLKFSIDKERTNLVDSELIEEIRKLNDPELLTKAIVEYSYQFWISGELETSINILEKEKNYFNLINNQETKGTYYNLLGVISSERGDLDISMEYFEHSLNIRKLLNNQLLTAQVLNNLALYYAYKRKFDIAEEYSKQSIVLTSKYNNPFFLSNWFDTLFEIYYLSNNEEKAKEIVSKLEELSNSFPESIDLLSVFQISQALLFKMSDRLRYKMKAGEILSQIIYNEKYDKVFLYMHKQRAIKHYCEILFLELQALGNSETLQEIIGVVNQLENIARNQNSHITLIETLILRSKLALIEGKFSETQKFLEHAMELSIQYGITQLTNEILHEKETFEKELTRWNDLVRSNAPMYEKLEKSKIFDYIKQVQEKFF